MSFPLTMAIAGLGNRGRWNYAKYAEMFPDRLKIVAVADILPERVQEAAKTFDIPENRCYGSAKELVEQEKLADILCISTPDRDHYQPAIPALRKGYHLLLEKPISPSVEECREIVRVAKEEKKHVVVCHVLRYTPFFGKIKEIIDAGTIGEVVTIHNIECVGYYHQAHSFVRGNWRDSASTSPMILQKCCHDMDILMWLAGKHLKRVSSYGDLYLFRKERAPQGATPMCMGGCKVKATCPYDAEKIYITDEMTGVAKGHDAWPNNVLTMYPTEESVRQAITEGPYGRCVYQCDNDVVDHQVVNLELEDGLTVSHTMSGFTARQYRSLKIMGTLGDIDGDMDTNLVKVNVFGKEPQIIDIAAIAEDLSGHAGGDKRMMDDLTQLVANGSAVGTALTSIDHSLESHYACFAAEHSRLHGGESVNIEKFFNRG